MYLHKSDVDLLVEHLDADEEIAWLVQLDSQPGWWAARANHPPLWSNRHVLWHVPSGPLPYVTADYPPDGSPRSPFIPDPWNGWEEKRPGADPWVPYFGPSWPGVYNLALNQGPDSLQGAEIAISGLVWSGNTAASIGRPAAKQTQLHWARLRRWLEKVAPPQMVPDIIEPTRHAKVYAFPEAHDAILRGVTVARFELL